LNESVFENCCSVGGSAIAEGIGYMYITEFWLAERRQRDGLYRVDQKNCTRLSLL